LRARERHRSGDALDAHEMMRDVITVTVAIG
jgi:hypothetical protein